MQPGPGLGAGPGPLHMLRGFSADESVTKQQLKPGTIRRIAGYARPYRWNLVIFLVAAALDAVITVAIPVLLGWVIDRGVLPKRVDVVIWVAAIVAGLAIFDAFLNFVQRWDTARVGQGLIYDLRTQVFTHVQRQPIAFFTRAQTGSLVSRLNTDVIGAQEVLTTTLVSTVSSVLQLILVLVTMLYFSWLVTVVALALIPMFIFPARLVGRRLQRLSRESMQLNAVLGSTMTERFNVAGAMLAKLFGEPSEESDLFAGQAAKVRDLGVVQAMIGSTLFIALTLLASLSLAAVYGVGGDLAVGGALQVGTLVSLALLLNRLYGPITALSNVQVNVMTALVSFDRVFEVLDLKPLIEDRPGAVPLVLAAQSTQRARGNGSAGPVSLAAEIVFDHVSFHYPAASEVSLASLESIALPAPERTDVRSGVLHDVSFTAPARKLTALVGPSGAGKTTITHLVSRLYDPDEGTVRIGGFNIRDVTQRSLHDVVGVVTQDAHLFHDTIRANLTYARRGATEGELIEACQAAQIWDLVSVLPDGLDTIVGDRGFRLSGGEKQRVALARLLLKAPAVVVLDEATAHLDSESEAAVQQALKTALTGRTSLVIAHRLSTIREADQILVIDEGRIRERGQHDELLASGGLYADLYRTQFARQEPVGWGLPGGYFPPHPPPGGHGLGPPGMPPPGMPGPGGPGPGPGPGPGRPGFGGPGPGGPGPGGPGHGGPGGPGYGGPG
jgi:ATP-binding cassette subfamily B protein